MSSALATTSLLYGRWVLHGDDYPIFGEGIGIELATIGLLGGVLPGVLWSLSFAPPSDPNAHYLFEYGRRLNQREQVARVWSSVAWWTLNPFILPIHAIFSDLIGHLLLRRVSEEYREIDLGATVAYSALGSVLLSFSIIAAMIVLNITKWILLCLLYILLMPFAICLGEDSGDDEAERMYGSTWSTGGAGQQQGGVHYVSGGVVPNDLERQPLLSDAQTQDGSQQRRSSPPPPYKPDPDSV